MNWASAIEGLPAGAKALLIFLAKYSDSYGVSWYKQEAIAREVCCTTRSIRNHLKVLVHFGIVRRIGQSLGGRQTSNAYHLFAWPGRQLIPHEGHGTLGASVRETLETRQKHGWQGKDFPAAEENLAEHNSETNYETTSVRKEAIEVCLTALGPWATEGNSERLRKDYRQLADILSINDLYLHILPALRKMAASDPTIPLIRSWEFFLEAIESEARRVAGAMPCPGLGNEGEAAKEDGVTAEKMSGLPGLLTHETVPVGGE